MATVTSLTASRLLALEADTVIGGHVTGDNLILEQHDGSTIDAGNVRGPTGATGPTGPTGPAGSPGDTGSVSVAGDTLIKRTSDGRGKVATPTAAEDATRKDYVDGLNSSRVSDIAALDTRIDTLEAGGGGSVTGRCGAHINTTDMGAVQNTEYNICTVTIPNPINGATYRVMGNTNIVGNAASTLTQVRIRHGINANTGGTQIAQSQVTLPSASGRAQDAAILVEFTYTGTTGQANYNVVMTGAPVSSSSRHQSISGQPSVLTVDRVL